MERKRKVASGRLPIARPAAPRRLIPPLDALPKGPRRVLGLAENFRRGHFFLAMPKTWPYIQKNSIRGFFASEKRTERRERVQALGRHLLLELFDCDAEALNSLETVKASMVEAAKRAQATIVDVVFHEFNPFGISGVVVIAESHLAIHTWPEYRYAAVDIFSCGDVLQPQTAANYLVEQFRAVPPSAEPAVAATFVTFLQIIVSHPLCCRARRAAFGQNRV